jgi:D-sedoheptulose 7-phosphate isomerase
MKVGLYMSFSKKYLEEVSLVASNIDVSKVEAIVKILAKLKLNNGRLFVLGIGGSAANASHAVNDFRKLAGIEAYAPTDNVSEVTARTNDDGFETIFVSSLSVSKLSSKDCIFILSVGGGDLEKNISKGICLAIDFAKERDAQVIGIVGREGGYTYKHADICLVIPQINPAYVTQHSEAFQSVVWHLLVSHPDLKENPTKW